MLIYTLLLHILPEAQAFARKDLPVPGGPYNKIPFHGFLNPTKISGNWIGNNTASYKAFLAFSNPATSDHFTFGFSFIIACLNESFSCF